MPGSLQGPALFVFGALGAYLGARAGRRLAGAPPPGRRAASRRRTPGWVLARADCVGIGLHNFGEGLAIGSAFALGELALGTLLIVGFTLHNTTEGLAIVAPLARQQASRRSAFAQLAAARADWRRADDSRRVAWRVRLFAGARGVVSGARRRRHRAGDAADSACTARASAAWPLTFAKRTCVAGLAAGVLVMYVTGTDRRVGSCELHGDARSKTFGAIADRRGERMV